MAKLARHLTLMHEVACSNLGRCIDFFFFLPALFFHGKNLAYKELNQCIEPSRVNLLYFTVMKLFEYMYFNSHYWNFLSTSSSLHIIETSWVHPYHFNVLNLFKNRYLTSLKWIFLSTCTLFQWIEAFWLHILCFIVLNHLNVPHFTISKHFEFMWYTLL